MSGRATSELVPPPQDDEEARLLEAVFANPDDDSLRMVYADHLLRRGDPRGELYGIQTELERGLPPWERHLLVDRERDLIFVEPRARQGTVIWRRGVPAGSRLDPTEIRDELPAFLQLMYWSTTRTPELDAGLAKLSTHPQLSTVEEFDLGGLDHARWTVMLGSAMRPRRLALVEYHDDRTMPRGHVEQLRDAPLCERVEQLELSACIGDAQLAQLAAGPWLRNVMSLVAGGRVHYATAHGLGYIERKQGPITDAGVRTIATSMRALRRLDLRWNRITADGIRTLADSTLALDELRLTSDGLGAGGLEALAASRLARVARVAMGPASTMTPETLRALLESPLWVEHWIDLWWTSQGAKPGELVDAIGVAKPVRPITELRLRGAKLDVAELEQLLTSSALASLQRLTLVEIQRRAHASAFFSRVLLRPLETLVIERCHLGTEGLIAALASPHAGQLEQLVLDSCSLGEEGVRVLARSSIRPEHLTVIDRARGTALAELLGSPVLARTAQLHVRLSGPNIEPDLAAALRAVVETPHLRALRTLALPDLADLEHDDRRRLQAHFGDVLRHPRF